MKRILLLLFSLITTAAIGQYPINQILSSDSTMVSVGRNATGGIRGGLVNMVFADTTAANLSRISYYTGAQIWTTTDSAIWVRFKGTPSFWVKMAGASGGTTGSFWNITGNYFGGGVPLNYGVGTNSYDYLPLKTNNITRLLIPPDGILRSSAPANKYLMMDTTTLEMYYGDGGGGSGWSLTGNAGTTSSNFIGTTDGQPLMFRYNNLNAGSIGKSSGGTYLGIGAGENDNAEDEPNVGVGYYALYYNTTGSANSAVGASALASNTTGSGNSAVGVVALYNNTTGNGNSAVGANALSSNTTGYNNSAVGTSAGDNAKQKTNAIYQNLFGAYTYGTRDSITVLGADFIKETIVRGKLIDSTLSAGAGTKAVRWNSSTGEFTYADTTAGGGGGGWSLTGNAGTNPASNFIGTTDDQPLSFRVNNTWAGRIYTNGSVFIGDSSGVNNSALNNAGFGRYSLYNNTTGSYNTGSGAYSLYGNTTGWGNTGSGVYSLYSNTSGEGNTGSGAYSLYSNIDGELNTGSGLNSLYNNTTGLDNTGSGAYSLYSNTSGEGNTGSGVYSLYGNTTGGDNTGSGAYSLYGNTTGWGNTGSGVYSLYNNTTGEGNTGSGAYSLYSNTSGEGNTGMGYAAGYNAKQKVDAKNQILIGANTYGTRDSIAVIGASFMKETILRGKLIDSTLSAGAGTKAVRWNSSTGEFTYADTTAGNSVNLVFGGGSGASADTAVFTTSAIYGSFYNDADTIVVTSMRSVLQGTSPDVTYKVWYNDSLNVEAGATALVTAGSQVTNTTTGTNVTSFDVTKIPPGVWVWVKTSAVTTKPTYFSLTINANR